jgi:hypothetical protein
MKRILLIILSLVLCLPAFSGCVKEPDFVDVAVVPIGGDASPGLYQTTFHFDSYKEMIKGFREYDLSKSSYTIQYYKALLDKPYSDFVDRVNADKSFPQPMKGGEPIELRDAEGFSNITFLVRELYGLPWILYYPKFPTGENFYIKMTYLPSDIDRSLTASEIIRQLSPNSPNVDNLGERHKSIFERQIKLSDREVTALVCEYNDDSRSNIAFVYGEMLVEVKCKTEVWSDEWFAELSFE